PKRLLGLLVEQGCYFSGPENEGVPFRKRSLTHPLPSTPSKPVYADPSTLPGESRRLPLMVHLFFIAILNRLKTTPMEFNRVVEELGELLKQHGLKVKMYRSYQYLRDWDHLISTLDEISRYPAQETFDLFCGALFAYYDLVNPPR
ncbi:MAG: hypothetical protein OEW12_09535, partial [Deltaproteobacteria bacterium]|nr:hypothetical protein [Deltaproteobacteria bacterium]